MQCRHGIWVARYSGGHGIRRAGIRGFYSSLKSYQKQWPFGIFDLLPLCPITRHMHHN